MNTFRSLLAAGIAAALTACAPGSPTAPSAVVDPSDASFDGVGFGSGNRDGGMGYGSGNTTARTAETTVTTGSTTVTGRGGMMYGSGNRNDGNISSLSGPRFSGVTFGSGNRNGPMTYGSGHVATSTSETTTTTTDSTATGRGGVMFGSGN